jgi:hypothetical protein
MAGIVLRNNLQPHIYGSKDHPGVTWLLSVAGGFASQIEFDGSHSCYQAFESLGLGDSIEYTPGSGCPTTVALSLTVGAPFQVSQRNNNISVAVGLTAEICYFIPNWEVAQANYGLQIGSQPVIDLGYAVQTG